VLVADQLQLLDLLETVAAQRSGTSFYDEKTLAWDYWAVLYE